MQSLPYIPDPDSRLDRQVQRIGARKVLLAILAALGLAGTIWAAVWGPSRRGTGSLGQPDRVMYAWVAAILIVSIVVMVLSMTILLLAAQGRWAIKNANLRSQRVAKLTQSLTEALSTIEGIRREVEEGQALLQRLEQEKEINSQLAQLTATETEAVRTTLALVLRRDRVQGLPTVIAINLGCGLVGLVVGHYVF